MGVNGTLDVIAVRNTTRGGSGSRNASAALRDAVEEFALFYKLPAETHEALVRAAEARLRLRASKRQLARVPITAPDGRPLELDVRDGEQHDIDATITRFCI